MLICRLLWLKKAATKVVNSHDPDLYILLAFHRKIDVIDFLRQSQINGFDQRDLESIIGLIRYRNGTSPLFVPPDDV